MEQPTANPLALAVRRVLGERGLSLHAAHQNTGIDRGTLTRMWNGQRPSLNVLERFVAHFRLDVNEWRRLAGYPAVGEPDATDRARALVDGIAALREEFPDQSDFLAPLDAFSAPNLTEEGVAATLAAIRRYLEGRRGMGETGSGPGPSGGGKARSKPNGGAGGLAGSAWGPRAHRVPAGPLPAVP